MGPNLDYSFQLPRNLNSEKGFFNETCTCIANKVALQKVCSEAFYLGIPQDRENMLQVQE